MAKNNLKSDPIFQIFKDKFQVTLFYKPEATDISDNHYHIILDNLILIQFMILGSNFIVIDTIQPLTSGYIPKTYNTLLDVLMEQTKYSVLIEKLGNVTAITDACVKKDVPIVVDDRFITIPIKLYRMYERMYKTNMDNCGFYLLAMNSNLDDVPERNDNITQEQPKETETKLKTLKPENKIYIRDRRDVNNTSLSIADRIVSLFDSRTTIEEVDNHIILHYLKIMDVTMTYNDDTIKLESFNQGRGSSVDFMECMAILEGLCDTFTVIVDNVTNRYVYDVCEIRGYQKDYLRDENSRLGHRQKNSFGTYIMIKPKK